MKSVTSTVCVREGTFPYIPKKSIGESLRMTTDSYIVEKRETCAWEMIPVKRDTRVFCAKIAIRLMTTLLLENHAKNVLLKSQYC